jgi:hypothetical protein
MRETVDHAVAAGPPDPSLMASYERYPRWVRIGVWVCIVGLVAMVLASVLTGF